LITFVLDASVAVKWVVQEAGRRQAIDLLTPYEAEAIDLQAPRQIMEEVASALSKLCRRRKIRSTEAELAFRTFEARKPKLVEDPNLVGAAFALSLQHQISVWDCLYLALTIDRRADVITADARFYRAVRSHYPFVRMLG
jgi:predicted nucleic acid-binding protein